MKYLSILINLSSCSSYHDRMEALDDLVRQLNKFQDSAYDQLGSTKQPDGFLSKDSFRRYIGGEWLKLYASTRQRVTELCRSNRSEVINWNGWDEDKYKHNKIVRIMIATALADGPEV